MMEHASLTSTPQENSFDKDKVKETTKNYMKEILDDTIRELVNQEEQETLERKQAIEQLQKTLDEVKTALTELSNTNKKTNDLKLQVLQKLKAKLETV